MCRSCKYLLSFLFSYFVLNMLACSKYNVTSLDSIVSQKCVIEYYFLKKNQKAPRPSIISLKNVFYHVICVHRICKYLTQSIGTAAHVTRREESTPEPRAAGVPVYAVNITVYHLRNTALRASTRNKRRTNQQPSEQRFQSRSSKKHCGLRPPN